jgi:FkbM family methyltransferase
MIDAARLGRLGRRAYWSLRSRAGARPASNEEALSHLRGAQRQSGSRAAGVARMPWGDVEYTSIDVIVAQFDELFLRRHYAVCLEGDQPVIVDCGGNIGLSAIWFKQAYPRARVVVYEADPSLATTMARNLRRARLDDVSCQNVAVWTENGTVSFTPFGDDTGRISNEGGMRVPAIDLATHLPDRVDLLKIDIEGAEFPVLERLCESGAIARVSNLVAELHVTRGRTDAMLALLQRLRASGLEISMTAGVGPWIGLADTASPFDTIDRNNVFMILYAWRPRDRGPR